MPKPGQFAIALLLSVSALSAIALSPAFRSARTVHPVSGKAIMVPGRDGDATLLFNGWRIQPAGKHLPTPDSPLGGRFSPNGKLYAVAHAGYNANGVTIVDVETETQVAFVPIGRAFNGLAWKSDTEILVPGGISNVIADVFSVKLTDGVWKRETAVKSFVEDRTKVCASGLCFSADGKILFALNQNGDQLVALNEAGEPVGKLTVGDHPLMCRLMPGGKRLLVANWGGSELAEVDVSDPATMTVTRKWPTAEHPNDIAIAKDGRVFVSCGNADEVRVFNAKGKAQETIKTALTSRSPLGTTPIAVAVSPDDKLLAVANADNNNVCVVDISKSGRSKVKGFVPTGWYPTAVAFTPDGKRLIIGSGKGMGTGPNMIRTASKMSFSHIGKQLNGAVSFLPVPSDEKLAEFTKTVITCSPYKDDVLGRLTAAQPTIIPTKVGDNCPIKHVLYIVKENRTYDQVLSDLSRGNGDKNLLLFGREVTPNHHALAEQFVLLDNLYCNGEVSADGHPWSTSAYATDWTQRSWLLSYSAKGSLARTLSVQDPRGGYLWEAALKKGLRVRSYGEYAQHPSLAGNISEKWIAKVEFGEKTRGRDMLKVDIFLNEFAEFEKNGKMPHFMIMSLGEDHTDGTKVGSFSPKSCVGSNDLALGKIVEAVSKSKYWEKFAIFVIEDDAQNGPDHVDSHRTIGFVASPYAKRGIVDSTQYTTASMLRTMELILGLKPLTQFDAAATPMFACFGTKKDLRPYTLLPPQIDLNVKNVSTAYGAAESGRMDFSEYDKTDEQALNRILWHSIKGANVPMPAPVRRAVLSSQGTTSGSVAEHDEDDGDRKPASIKRRR